MTESTAAPRHLSHQGRHLRLSLPTNDDRREGLQHLEIREGGTQSGIDFPLGIQTVSIFPDTGDETDMRVVCSISDRVQWEQRVRQVKERRLQELGVGQIINTDYNQPSVTKANGPSPMFGSRPCTQAIFQTPVGPTAATLLEKGQDRSRLHEPSGTHSELASSNTISTQTLATNVAFLRAKHHELSRSVSELAQNNGQLAHGRSLSQRELVHERLNSIAPVRVRNNGSLVGAGIEPIVEEETDETEKSTVQEVSGDSDEQISTQKPSSAPTVGLANLHQHLASHDMSELIKVHSAPRQNLQGDLYLPDFDNEYGTFRWADEPMESDIQLHLEGHAATLGNEYMYPYDPLPGLSYMPPETELHLPLQPQHFTPYFSSYGGLPVEVSLAQNLQTAIQPLPRTNHYDHVAKGSSFNIQAEEFVPFSKAIVKPSTESQAIPIIRPTEVCETKEGRHESGDLPFQESASYQPQTDGSSRFDAYDGFDSGSDTSSVNQADHLVEEPQTQLDSNEERVKSFKFPSPAKPCTPSRSRTGLFVSPSPEGGECRSIPALAPPAWASTPRRSPPKMFHKSVGLEDGELDSIIMDLSIREIVPRDDVEGDSTMSEDNREDLSPSVDEKSAADRSSRRVSSAKLILSHQDADMGLLLDAMLSAKFASVTDVLNNMQLTMQSLEDRIDPSTMSGRLSEQLNEIVRQELKSELEKRAASEHTRQIEESFAAKTEQRIIAERLRGDLANALAELEKLRSDDRKTRGSIDDDDASAADEALETYQERIRVLLGAKTGLQKSVGELTAKAARLEGQLLDSTTFCSALQSQYSTSELAVTRLRKELRDVQMNRDQVKLDIESLTVKYNHLQEDLQMTATQIADEQSKWRDSEQEKDAKIEYLQRRLNDEERRLIDASTRRSSTISIANSVNEAQLSQYLMDRVKALELSCQHLQTSHRDALQTRDARLDSLLQEWKQMSRELSQAERTIEGLRAEIVLSAESQARLSAELRYAEYAAQTHASQKCSPVVSSLKRSKSESEVRNELLADRAIVQLTAQVRERDARIAELEEILNKPADSTERQIRSAISENISLPTLNSFEGTEEVKTEPFKSRVAELKRMRISWESKHSTTAQQSLQLQSDPATAAMV